MQNYKNSKVILFDFDGTLVDTMGAFADVAGRLMASYFGGTIEEGRQAYLATSGIPFFQQLAVLHPASPLNERVSEEFERDKLHAYESKGLFPDVGPAVEQFRKLGVKTVVSSNNFTPIVEKFLETQSVRFDLVLGYGKGMCKGESHFAFVEKELGVSRQQMCFVGDSVRDGELALAGGLMFMARTGTVDPQRFIQLFGKDAFPLVDTLADVVALLS